MRRFVSNLHHNERVQPQSAVELIHKLVMEVSSADDRFFGAINEYFIPTIFQRPHEISLVCIGPLTNLALAFKTYDDIRDKIKEVYVMGGNYNGEFQCHSWPEAASLWFFFSFAGVGNISSSAEYNFYTDPEAAYIVLESAKCPITIVPWEACLKESVHVSMVSGTFEVIIAEQFT